LARAGVTGFPARSVHPGGGRWFTEPEVAEIEPLDEQAEQAAASRKRGKLAPLAVGAALLGVVVVFLIRTNNLDDRPTVIQTRERYPVGSCVVVDDVTSTDPHIQEISCNGPNSGRVVAKVELPRPCPLQTVNVVLLRDGQSLCLQR
jgi:hypothetical protein